MIGFATHLERPGADAAVLFVHGLDGDPLKTWGDDQSPGAFIARVAALRPHASVLYTAYPARLNAYAADGRQTVATVAGALAQAAPDQLLKFSSIEVIAHCLGGPIITQALRYAWERSAEAQRSLADVKLRMTFLDCPQLIPQTPSPWLARLIEALGIEPEQFGRNVNWLKTVRPTPCLVIGSRAQSWLDACSPYVVARPRNRIRLPLAHTELGRAPASGPFAPLDVVADWLG